MEEKYKIILNSKGFEIKVSTQDYDYLKTKESTYV